ncbi:PEP-CTERM sorting domain-containing protein [Persicirhabdus sediminis]|uniref:PEP-CTERM sorting domain-containing protein n=1 Tax=Persicirhabdus sediminis TaxID=454144 RepID=A0A8J7SMB2_9BACT|nr:PEP-CTERM sorting domain-containing protein [Persicirhabdus sediminis]MBK1792866.1 PEP-CTERM sorting domain-containing protein [Persicirhabdus sediminis]
MKIKKITATLAISLIVNCSAHAATYLVGASGPESRWESYLEATFTAESLGEIVYGTYLGGPPTAGAGDVVIMMGSVNSGKYDDGTETDDWNNLAAGLLNTSAYLVRNTRWDWMNTEVMSTDELAAGAETFVKNSSSPLLAGVTVTNGMANLFNDGVATGQIANSDVGAGDMVLNHEDANGFAMLTSWSSGDAVPARTDESFGGDRIYFGMGAGVDSLTSDGELVLTNALEQLGLVVIPEPSSISMFALTIGVFVCRRRRSKS